MALTVDGRAIFPLTAEHVIQMVNAGILGEDDPVELLDGVLSRVSPKSMQHQVVIGRLFRWLVTQPSGARHEVLTEAALRVPEATSLPEPDLLVLPPGASVTEPPRTALLVAEVAVTSHTIDLGRKAELYAAAGVPEYWVVDVPDQCVARFSAPAGGRFTQQAALAPPAALRPLAIDAEPLELATLFAGF